MVYFYNENSPRVTLLTCQWCFTQSWPALCDPMDCSPPGSSVRGALQARILEWVAMASSRGSSRPRDWTPVPCVPCRGRRVFATEARGSLTCHEALELVCGSISVSTRKVTACVGDLVSGQCGPPMGGSRGAASRRFRTVHMHFCRVLLWVSVSSLRPLPHLGGGEPGSSGFPDPGGPD